MSEDIENAKEELKRVDHLIYVSLKYTRTCDIFKSIIERLINSIDCALEALLKKLEDQNRIMDVPEQPGLRCSTLREHYKDEQLHKILDFFLLLRQFHRADFCREREFRRHVTMTMEINDEKHEINIDNITQYYKDTKEYLEHIEKMLEE